MRVSYNELKERNRIVVWGTGQIMKKTINNIDPELKIRGFCNTYPQNWGKEIYKEMKCFSKDELQKNDAVLIAMKSKKDVEIVSKELDDKGIDYCHIQEAVDGYRTEWDKQEIKKYKERFKDELQHDKNKRIVKFVNCSVPYKFCNLRCDYCYVQQARDFVHNVLKLHSPQFIRCALSQKRLGGVALLNFCAGGETLLVKELIPIFRELIEEGHYISIVTNGTITETFDYLLDQEMDFSHIFIKFSFHYKELIKRNLLDQYFDNIKKISQAGCSFTVELVPSDDLVPYIEDIKNLCMERVGAIPHLTIPRDDTVKEMKILTKYDLAQYRQIWGSFDSKMFDFKYDNLYIQRFEDCKAGEWSFQLNLESGEIYKCVKNPYLDNIYEDICRDIYLESVGNNCCLSYCYNCHAYLAFGLVKEIDAPTFYEVRDRVSENGEHWVKDEMKMIFTQRLYENNE